MARTSTLNMTEGNTTKLLIRFSIPMLIGNVFQQIYNLVDSVVVGRFVGANALAAIGASSYICFLFIALCNGIASGGGVITAQHFGAGDEKRIRSSLVNVAYLLMGVSIAIGVIAYITTPWILQTLKTPAEIIEDSTSYMRMMCIGLPLVAIYNYASGMLRALGDSKGPLYFLIVSCLINVALDLYFVKALGMNVFGVALATVIAQFIAGLLCMLYAFKTNSYFTLNKENFKLEGKIIKETLRIGIPMSLQFGLIAISCMGLQVVVNSFGAVAVAAFTATSRIEQLVHQPYTSLGQALATYSGQNYGANKIDRIREGFRKSTKIMLSMTVILVIVMQFFGTRIVEMFVRDADVIAMGGRGLKITSLFYVVLGMIYVTRGTQNGIGDAAFALINGIVEVIARIILPAVLVTLPIFGLWGIWWSAGLVWFISAVFCIIRYVEYDKRVLGKKTKE